MGEVYSFGLNGDLQSGREGESLIQLGKIESLQNISISSVSCGRVHSSALSSSGKLFTFGSGMNGRLGNGSSSKSLPEMVEDLSHFTVIDAVCGKDFVASLVEV